MIDKLLAPYYHAAYPAIALETAEEQRVIDALVDYWVSKQIYSISASGGLVDEHSNRVADPQCNFPKAFEWVANKDETILVVRDFQHVIGGAAAYRVLLRHMAAMKARATQVIMLAPSWNMPAELKREIPVIPIPLPTYDELRASLKDIIESQPDGSKPKSEEVLVHAARGLTISEAENVFALCSTSDFDPLIVEREKMRLVRSNCMTVEQPMPIESLGGLGRLKEYVQCEVMPWKGDAQLMVRGVLMVGVPGTGKSLASRVIASLLGWPLVRFDMASAKAGRVGESEGNLKAALAIADAIAPCVLWADEVEKSVGGYQSSAATDGGTTSAMVGMLLTWSQEHTSPVMMVMTCNDYSKLPPEMTRPGRIDEKFFLDVPMTDERFQISGIHLMRLCPNLSRTGNTGVGALATYLSSITADYTGAEIEQIIKSAARRTQRKITEAALKQAASEINPIARTSNIKELREWANNNLRMANDAIIEPKAVRKIKKEEMN